MQASFILLSGGKSSRMGTNKALLPVEGKATIAHLLDMARPHFQEIICVTNEPEVYHPLLPDVQFVQDQYVGQGPLAGIHAGLLASGQQKNVIAACDMPFLSMEVAVYMLEQSEGWQAVIPHIEGRNQPLFAVYDQSCLPEVENCLQEEMLRVNFFLKRLKTKYLSEAELPQGLNMEQIFFNMNKPTDYEQVQAWLKAATSNRVRE